MFKKFLLLLTLPAVVFAKPTVHDNRLHLFVQGRIYPIDFRLESLPPTPETDYQTSEPWSLYPMNSWGGISAWFHRDWVNGDDRYWINGTFSVMAPRKKNAKVAKWAARQQNTLLNNYNKGKVYATVSGGSVATAPDALNFAFIGTLVLGGMECKNVIIAQGNTATINNWWIYSNFWPMDKNGKPAKEGYRNRIQCKYLLGSTRQFTIKRGSISNRFYLIPE